MYITYDPTKNAKNRETRYLALGLLKTRLYVLVFTETESGIRVISLRKANKREILRYEQYQKTTN